MNLNYIAGGALAAAMLLPLAVLAQGAAKDLPKEAAKPAAAPSGPLATVNGVAIPRARAELVVRNQTARGQADNDQLRGAVREELINREVIVQEATRSGLARKTEVQTQLDLARQEVLVGAYIGDWVRGNPITDSDVQKEYDRMKAEMGDKEYRSRHILVETEDQAKSLIADLRKGGKFDDLAAKNSKDPGTREKGGDLDWQPAGNFDKAYATAMVKLEKGKFTDVPARTRYGFHVIQLDDVRDMRHPPLGEVKQQIQRQLTQRKIEGLVKDLRTKAKVE